MHKAVSVFNFQYYQSTNLQYPILNVQIFGYWELMIGNWLLDIGNIGHWEFIYV